MLRGAFVGFLAMTIGIGVLLIGAYPAHPFDEQMGWTAITALEQMPWVVLAGAIVGAVLYPQPLAAPSSQSPLPMSPLALRLLGALAFAVAPAILVAFDVFGGARGVDALIPLVLLVVIPAAVGAAAYPWLVRVDRQIVAAARAGAAGFAMLAVIAGLSWAAARGIPKAAVGGWLYAVALLLASPVGIVAASVAAAAWRQSKDRPLQPNDTELSSGHTRTLGN